MRCRNLDPFEDFVNAALWSFGSKRHPQIEAIDCCKLMITWDLGEDRVFRWTEFIDEFLALFRVHSTFSIYRVGCGGSNRGSDTVLQ